MTTVHDLDLAASDHRRTSRGERFKIRVAASPGGAMPRSAAVSVQVPPEVRRLTTLVERRESTGDDLVVLGRLLGDLLLPPGPVRERFEACRAGVTGVDRLRVRLQLAGALADLPWEYAYLPRDDAATDDELAGFLALDRRLSLVRHHPLDPGAGPPPSLAPVTGGRLRLIALLATPDDPAYPKLQVAAERGAIAGAVKRLTGLETSWVEHATFDKLERAVDQPAHVLHFAGHGEFTTDLGEELGTVVGRAFLVLEDDEHRPDLLGAEQVALQVAGAGIQLAVLGACHSGRRDAVNPWAGVAPALIRTAGIPAAVGMQFTIADQAAVQFSRRLYERLAEGLAVEEAVTAGRLAIALRKGGAERDWGVPVLYLRGEGGPLFPVAAAVDRDGVAEQARAATARVLREWRGEGEGRWVPELFTPRPAVDEALDAFLAADERAVMVVAPSGYGKTTELAHRAEAWAGAGHAVVLLDAARWRGTDVEGEVCAALGIEGGLAAVAGVLSADHQLVVLVDGVNEFSGPAEADDRGEGGRHGVESLVEALDGLAGTLPAHCRLVAACSQPAWDRVAQVTTSRGRMGPLTAGRWHGAGTGGAGIVLRAFDADEAALAFARYARRFRLATSWDDLPPATRSELSVPLVLRLCAEAYRGRAVPPVGAGLAMLRSLWEGFTPAEREVALELAGALLAAGTSTIALAAARRRSRELREAIAADGGPYAALVERGVLTEAYDPVSLTDRVGFSHGRFGAFVAGVAAHAEAGGGDSPEAAVRDLVSPRATSLAWDAARLLLARLWKDEVVTSLAGDASPDLRHVAVGAVVERYPEDPAGAARVLRSLLVGGPDQAGAWRQGSGFKATLELGGVGLEHLRWAVTHSAPSLRRAAGSVIALHWERDAAFTDSVLDDLSRAIRFRQPRRARRLLEAMT
ncbi:MAG TPA: CHAT domain-containing protein, partial [Acidimicrobiales bacterium]|nr:CHAT domain-containing protein [Acidimicrobiales bacterium]